MSNPYQAPRAPTASGSEARRLSIYSLACAVLTALVPTLLVPGFRESLAAYGGGLPWLTAAVFALHHGLWLLPVLVFVAWRGLPGVLGLRVARALGIGGLLVLLPLVIIGLYLPIFRLAATIG